VSALYKTQGMKIIIFIITIVLITIVLLSSCLVAIFYIILLSPSFLW